jgi:hypothetical protein
MLHTKNYSYNEFAITGANKFTNTGANEFANTFFRDPSV